ncbi:tigger transposable element-derived protein 1 [Trichonephila clavipes]|nr:tigger transposable element-derived protein 1 [Trichonephila clavipes]
MEKKTHQGQSISLETKLAILDRLGKGEGSTAIGKHFNLGESTVRAIKKNEAAIRKSVISGTRLNTKFASYRRDVLLERTERAIAIWIEEQVQRRIPDEKTASGHKASKDRVTLLLCSNASGDRMLKPLLINKSLRPRALKDELLVDDVLSDNDIIDLTLVLTVYGVVGLEGDNDEEEKSTPLTGKLIQEGLQLCSKLENHFLINDPNSERASKLQRRAAQNEKEVCENPWPLPQISIAERVSSDDEGDLEPLRKQCKPL